MNPYLFNIAATTAFNRLGDASGGVLTRISGGDPEDVTVIVSPGMSIDQWALIELGQDEIVIYIKGNVNASHDDSLVVDSITYKIRRRVQTDNGIYTIYAVMKS